MYHILILSYYLLFIKRWHFREYVSKYLFTSKCFSYIATVLRDKEHSKYIWTACSLEMTSINLNWTHICIWILFLKLNDWYLSHCVLKHRFGCLLCSILRAKLLSIGVLWNAMLYFEWSLKMKLWISVLPERPYR